MAYNAKQLPLVSIIIPTYNYAHFITETLTSVLDQTYQNWECIIIDDESGDDTTLIVNNFISAHPGYKFNYHRVENGGTSMAKNIGIKLSQGDFIQFLDADDLLSRHKIAVQVNAAIQYSVNIVFSKSLFFKGSAITPQIIEKYPENFLASKSLAETELSIRIIQNNVLTISSPLIKRYLVLAAGMFDSDLRNNEDWLFWFKIAQIHPHFIYDGDDKSFVLIRIHDHSAMNNQQNMFRGELAVRNYMHEALANKEKSIETKSLIQLNLDLLALHHLRSVNISKGLSHILSSFVKNPVHSLPLLAKGVIKLGTRFYKSIS
ncbi:glycosyltransferase family A protein [Pedobacter sp. Leaf250]|uniref:glycosyltransferase family 2 protein n=1 Tax=Pedobacter sp. Leaf250 TaxID=2876559 RepID=UPI001E3724D6|nr:glycosyltransferase family A protein [Pedobacter sp. Leaf250]